MPFGNTVIECVNGCSHHAGDDHDLCILPTRSDCHRAGKCLNARHVDSSPVGECEGLDPGWPDLHYASEATFAAMMGLSTLDLKDRGLICMWTHDCWHRAFGYRNHPRQGWLVCCPVHATAFATD